jgi:hypothetical protein
MSKDDEYDYLFKGLVMAFILKWRFLATRSSILFLDACAREAASYRCCLGWITKSQNTGRLSCFLLQLF